MNTEAEYKVELVAQELLLLDGKCGIETQKIVDLAKQAASFGESPQAKFAAQVVEFAKANGAVDFVNTSLSYCSVCGETAGYAKHKRSTQYHQKGSNNTAKRLYLPGIDFKKRGFISVKGYSSLGCCLSCLETAKLMILSGLEGVQVEIPERFSGKSPIYKKYEKVKCSCGWEGHEGEMKKLPTLMGDGSYPGECPSCGKRNGMFVTNIERTGDFVVISNSDLK
jgi:hypothetical protein